MAAGLFYPVLAVVAVISAFRNSWNGGLNKLEFKEQKQKSSQRQHVDVTYIIL